MSVTYNNMHLAISHNRLVSLFNRRHNHNRRSINSVIHLLLNHWCQRYHLHHHYQQLYLVIILHSNRFMLTIIIIPIIVPTIIMVMIMCIHHHRLHSGNMIPLNYKIIIHHRQAKPIIDQSLKVVITTSIIIIIIAIHIEKSAHHPHRY